MKKTMNKGEIARKSAKTTLYGGSSRPGSINSGKVKTPTSEPSDMHTMGRAPSKWLK